MIFTRGKLILSPASPSPTRRVHIEIVEFAMPAFGLVVTRDSDGTWRQGELVTIDLAIRESFDRSVIALNRALTSPEPARSLDEIETELSRLRGLTERLDDELERTSSRGEERSEYWGLSDRLAWRSSLERLAATEPRLLKSLSDQMAREAQDDLRHVFQWRDQLQRRWMSWSEQPSTSKSATSGIAMHRADRPTTRRCRAQRPAGGTDEDVRPAVELR
ncbi:MAG: hypothetical protein R3B96_23820 [Pirellulaceae bacterium]